MTNQCPKAKDCTPSRSTVKYFLVWEVLWKIENFLKYFYTLNNPGFWGNYWSSEDKLWIKKAGLYTYHKWSFAKIRF